jgi:cytolysin-activating lysine-acyltransferase
MALSESGIAPDVSDAVDGGSHADTGVEAKNASGKLKLSSPSDTPATGATAKTKAEKPKKNGNSAQNQSHESAAPAQDSSQGQTQSEPQSEPQLGAQQDPSSILGAAVWLMLSSPGHKHLFVTDFEWLLVPAILAKQFRLYRRDGVPIGFVSWARLTDEVDARIINGSVKLAPKEWTEGEQIWLIDVIAPFGGVEDIMGDLKKVFEGQSVKYIQADEKGRRVEVLK